MDIQNAWDEAWAEAWRATIIVIPAFFAVMAVVSWLAGW